MELNNVANGRMVDFVHVEPPYNVQRELSRDNFDFDLSINVDLTPSVDLFAAGMPLRAHGHILCTDDQYRN